MNAYFTTAYAELNDSRKIEVLVEQLVKIACYNDRVSKHDTDAVLQAINTVADLRELVSKN